MTVAARTTAEWKTFGNLPKRVATLRRAYGAAMLELCARKKLAALMERGEPDLSIGVSMSENDWHIWSRYNALNISKKIIELIHLLHGVGLIDMARGSYSGPMPEPTALQGSGPQSHCGRYSGRQGQAAMTSIRLPVRNAS